jgi:RNA polymerase sigma factor (TIGR02999 family)
MSAQEDDGVGNETSPSEHVTRLLQAVGQDRPGAAGELLPLVYDELRKLARQRMSRERADHTLQATGLVHEAYLRLIGNRECEWANRAHFFHAAGEAMRRILIDHARAKAGPRRGGGLRKLPLDVVELATTEDSEQILALDEAISRLEQQDPGAAEVVRLRFYAGLSVEDVAKATNSSPRTVKREWAFARAYLLQALQDK